MKNFIALILVFSSLASYTFASASRLYLRSMTAETKQRLNRSSADELVKEYVKAMKEKPSPSDPNYRGANFASHAKNTDPNYVDTMYIYSKLLESNALTVSRLIKMNSSHYCPNFTLLDHLKMRSKKSWDEFLSSKVTNDRDLIVSCLKRGLSNLRVLGTHGDKFLKIFADMFRSNYKCNPSKGFLDESADVKTRHNVSKADHSFNVALDVILESNTLESKQLLENIIFPIIKKDVKSEKCSGRVLTKVGRILDRQNRTHARKGSSGANPSGIDLLGFFEKNSPYPSVKAEARKRLLSLKE